MSTICSEDKTDLRYNRVTIKYMHVTISTTLLTKAILFMVGVGFLVLMLFVFNVTPAFAQVSEGLEVAGDASGLQDTNLSELIGNIIKVFLSVLGLIFLILVLYAGYLWMTSQGDTEKIKKAKDILINATIGLIITLSAYAITSFIISALTDAIDSGSTSTSSSSTISAERLSGSLGSGGISDHYPARNATEISRNTSIFVTFNNPMDIESFIEGYDTNGTPEDVSDDTVTTGLNTDNILIYASEDGEGGAFVSSGASVSFADDLKTFVFIPTAVLGSPTEDTSYTVFLDDSIQDTDGDTVINSGGYEWSFEVGTEIDTTPPTVRTVTPVTSGIYDRNIVVEITFSEAVDPTSASGIRESDSGFDNIQTVGTDGVPTAGEYVISNQYKTITFTSDDPCGTNSCGQTIYCLPGGQSIAVTVVAPTIGVEPPQVDIYPYDGIADTSGNGLDGDGDGTAGDDYLWGFTTTDDINLDAPVIDSISPNILGEDVALDQQVYITFDSIMMSSTLRSSTDAEDFIALTPSPLHEMWYSVSLNSLDADGADASTTVFDPVVSQAEVRHGVFFESVDEGTTYYYVADVGDGIKNQYQNCFVPGEGPDVSEGRCGASDSLPYCCNGVASDVECLF